jgi:hypothetical protein
MVEKSYSPHGSQEAKRDKEEGARARNDPKRHAPVTTFIQLGLTSLSFHHFPKQHHQLRNKPSTYVSEGYTSYSHHSQTFCMYSSIQELAILSETMLTSWHQFN